MIRAFYPFLSNSRIKTVIKELGEIVNSNPFTQNESHFLIELDREIPSSLLGIIISLKNLELLSSDFNPKKLKIMKLEKGNYVQPYSLESKSVLITLGEKTSHLIEGFRIPNNLDEQVLGNGDLLVFENDNPTRVGIEHNNGSKKHLALLLT